MSQSLHTITACIVVYNEEKVIERCLKSIASLVNEIVIVHDGECSDRTLEIAKKYTDKVFVLPHIGIAEPHRSFTYESAGSEWILQIDADEYIDEDVRSTIKNLTNQEKVNAYYFQWEFWDGNKPVTFKGLQKLFLFRKNSASFQGIPQKEVMIEGQKMKVEYLLHHQPLYENISFKMAKKKREHWLKSHVQYFFPELVTYNCFNATIDSWIKYTKSVRKHPMVYFILYPLKNLLGQLKNGLYTSKIGWNVALQQYIYYSALYWRVWKMNRKLKLP